MTWMKQTTGDLRVIGINKPVNEINDNGIRYGFDDIKGWLITITVCRSSKKCTVCTEIMQKCIMQMYLCTFKIDLSNFMILSLNY